MMRGWQRILRRVGCELQPFPTGDAGLQPELLADVVQSRGRRQRGNTPAHTLATARLRFLFLAAKIWRHAGRVGVSYSDHYEEKGIFSRLLDRLRAITPDGQRFGPVLATPLTG